MRIGVLAVQGALAEHTEKLRQLGAESIEIRQAKDMKDKNKGFDGLILPGGESTAMRKLLNELDLFEPLRAMIQNGLPVFGTCAGMILLAKKISGEDSHCFGTLDITVKRNAYGRQLGSFRCRSRFAGEEIEMPFIRAPYAESIGENVEILSEYDNRIVAVRQDNQLAAAFHPELTEYMTVYKYFFEMIEKRI